MKFLVAAVTLALLIAPAFAQSTTSSGSQNLQVNQNAFDNSASPNSAAAQKIKQTLEKVGFTDVNVVAQSFVVQGKSPDGDPVVMTIGPHGMSVFTEMSATGSGGTTGSSGGSSIGSATGSSNLARFTCSQAVQRCKKRFATSAAACASAGETCKQTGTFTNPRGKSFSGLTKN